ncbi:MAG: NAD(P)/FAD-dependent oxidoreductase [Herpetosiphon sp.]
MQANQKRTRVVVVGAGFGGLEVARSLTSHDASVLLLDRNNYHGFWPLLYQVATAGLEPQQIAQPVRAILRGRRNVCFQMATVQRIDIERRLVFTDEGRFTYDFLVLSAGSATNFFGMKSLETDSFELKDVPDAVALRNHLLECFEAAVLETDPQRRKQLLTFVAVGGGPTGVELAGAIAELVYVVMSRDYPQIDIGEVKVLLLEAMDRLLAAFPPSLSDIALADLKRLKVEVRFKTSVTGYDDELLSLKDDPPIPSSTVVWAAGVQGAELGTSLGIELQRGRRVPVSPTLQLADHPEVFVLGDMAYVPDAQGQPYPQLATVAMQQGRLVARNIRHLLHHEPLQTFEYWDKGSMATIGHRAAVARIWGMNWSGTIAWWLWLVVHLLYLAGVHKRLLVIVNWAYNFATFDRPARALVRQTGHAAINRR